jgi:hypothetical protein
MSCPSAGVCKGAGGSLHLSHEYRLNRWVREFGALQVFGDAS